MILDINESMKKHHQYLEAIDAARARLVREGFAIIENDAFELGAEWNVTYKTKLVARIEWNVPHMLSFMPYIDQQEEEFSIDYIKNFDQWKKFLDDIVKSLIGVTYK